MIDRLIGVDVSKWNLGWSPDKATEPINWVIQRASYGMVRDQAFAQMLPEVQKVDIRGAYHYYSTAVTWEAQARFFLETVLNKGFHFLVVDYERAYNNLTNTTTQGFVKMVDWLKRETGMKVWSYFNHDVFSNVIRPAGFSNWANAQDVWLAWYPYSLSWKPPMRDPRLPTGLNTWKAWQYGAEGFGTAGRTAGNQFGLPGKALDVNVFNGTLEDMKAYLGITAPTPEPTPCPEPDWTEHNAQVNEAIKVLESLKR